MKNLFCLFIIFNSSFVFGQTKNELIKQIIDYNIVESNCIGLTCAPSEQFKRFEKLKTLLSEKELLELSKHREPVIRAYVSKELIERDGENVIDLFSFEIDKNEMVETEDGCIGGFDDLSLLLYFTYQGSISSKKITKSDVDNGSYKRKIEKALENDTNLKILDSIVLFSNKDLNWMFYSIIFKKKNSQNFDARIKDLAFKYNNSFAFDYISAQCSTEVKKYFENDFLKANFDSPNKVRYLDRFVEYLLDSKNVSYKNLVIEKLKKDNYWKKHLNGIEDKLKKHQIML